MLKQYDAWTRKHASARCFERKADTSDDDDDTDGNHLDGDNSEQHLIGQLADLLVEAGSSDGPVDRQTALQWLLHTRAGSALIARLSPYRKQIDAACRKLRKDSTMTRDETLHSIVKRHGNVTNLAKFICSQGTSDITEHELTQLAVAEGEFAKKYGNPSSPGYADFWQANAICKARDMLRNRPVQDSDEDVDDDDRDNDDDDDQDDDAMDRLSAKAARLRKTSPDLMTPEQAFAKVYQDPANRSLVKRERRRNGYVFAR
jgi:hypothetical protein